MSERSAALVEATVRQHCKTLHMPTIGSQFVRLEGILGMPFPSYGMACHIRSRLMRRAAGLAGSSELCTRFVERLNLTICQATSPRAAERAKHRFARTDQRLTSWVRIR